ncbi:hypothetical protein ACVW00_000309 [Marmoricola sp. URHA0025 HA25]
MRNPGTLLTRVAVAALATGILALGANGLASADPNYDPDGNGGLGSGTTGTAPVGKASSEVWAGVGADAFAELGNNLAKSYNTDVGTNPVLASFDAVNPATGLAGDTITTKPGCSLTRPNGANGGLTALLNGQLATGAGGDNTSFCIDYVRASRGRDLSVNAGAEANLTFFAQSQDAVGYATVGHAYAPTSPLTTQQLKAIFECKVTDWSQVGGQAGAIHVFAQPSSAATYTQFLKSIGSSLSSVDSGCGALGTAGSKQTLSQQNDGRTLQGDPQAIAPYAITKWAAQENEPPGIRDYRGGALLGYVNTAVEPVKTVTVGPNSYLVLNDAFTAANPTFARYFYNAVRNAAQSTFAPVFGDTTTSATDDTPGYLCAHKDALLVPFGQLPLPSVTSPLPDGQYCGRKQP